MQTLSLFQPTSVALIGASADTKKLGHIIFKNLLDGGFGGTIWPVNPKGGAILGQTVHTSIDDVPDNVDLAIIVTPATTVGELVTACGKRRIKNVIVISAGFGETGTPEGKKREEELISIAQAANIALIGPNCLGMLCPRIGLNASFAAMPQRRDGTIGLISQSGAMAVALLDRGDALQLGFSTIVSIGNKAVLSEIDLLQAMIDDPQTQVIGMYLESLSDARKLATLARSTTKPIILVKAGVSVRGSHAVSSHTGALAGSTAALEAMAHAGGVHLARTTEEFFNLLAVQSTNPPLRSQNIGIITNAGGPGVLAVDHCERVGLTPVELEDRTKNVLNKTLPEAASTKNPIDVLGDALEDRYTAALTAVREDGLVDGMIVLLTPQVMTPCEEIAAAIIMTKKAQPLMPITTAFIGGGSVSTARDLLRAHGIPSYETPEEAVMSMRSLLQTEDRTREDQTQPTDDDRASGAHGILAGEHGLLSGAKTADLFSLYSLSLPLESCAKSVEEAVAIASRIGFPVIAKIASKDILHKTDIGGVRANLRTNEEVREAFNSILKNVAERAPSAGVDGIMIQQFLPIGREFIIGGMRDPSAGPLIMVGLGGIYTELFRDTCFRFAPASNASAYDMLASLRSWKLLTGMRGQAPLAIDKLAELLVTVSTLLHDCPSIQELDLNPVLVGPTDLVLADVKVVCS